MHLYGIGWLPELFRIIQLHVLMKFSLLPGTRNQSKLSTHAVVLVVGAIDGAMEDEDILELWSCWRTAWIGNWTSSSSYLSIVSLFDIRCCKNIYFLKHILTHHFHFKFLKYLFKAFLSILVLHNLFFDYLIYGSFLSFDQVLHLGSCFISVVCFKKNDKIKSQLTDLLFSFFLMRKNNNSKKRAIVLVWPFFCILWLKS